MLHFDIENKKVNEAKRLSFSNENKSSNNTEMLQNHCAE